MKSFIKSLVMITALAVMIVFTTSATAAAKPDQGGGAEEPPAKSAGVCATDGTYDYQYLPVERWSGATQDFHVRSNGGLVDLDPMQRRLQSGYFSVGDFFYGISLKFVTWSTQFCPLQTIGGAVDAAGAGLGKALLNSALLTGLVVMALLALLFQGASRDREWLKRLATKLLVLALFGIMVAGASASKGGGIAGDFETEYQPGTGSPGWFASTIDRVIGELASAPAAAISSEAVVDTVGSGDQLDCAPYLGALQKGYKSAASTDGVLDTAATPALTVSNLWQISGYNAWAVAQFGNKNMHGQNRVACRLLDRNAAIPTAIGSYVIEGNGAAKNRSGASVIAVMARVPEKNLPLSEAKQYVNAKAPAWRPLDKVESDKGWIAWASCVPETGQLKNVTKKDGWSVPKGNSWLIADKGARENAETVGGSKELQTACYEFFNKEGTKVDSIFDWGEGDKEINKHADEMPASIYDFISALHGTNQNAGGMAGLGYVVSAVGVFVVYGGIGIAITLVKVISLVMLFGVFFMMAVVLLPNADNKKLIKYVKEYVGLSLMSAFAIFIMAMVTFFVRIIWILLGNLTGGPNSMMTMLIGGLAPVMAAYALHRAFTSIGMPSPMTVKGATSWGKALAGGAAGGAMVAGVHQMVDGAQSFASRRARGATSKAMDGVKGKLSGLRNGSAGTEQKSTVAKDPAAKGSNVTAAAATVPESDGQSQKAMPEDVLADENASAAEKRAAQRELARESKAAQEASPENIAKQQAKEQRTERREERQQQRRALSKYRKTMTTDEKIADYGISAQEAAARGGAAITAGATAAGHAVGRVPGAVWQGAKNRTLDAQRWAKAVGSDPKATLAKIGKAGGKGAIGTAAVLGAVSLVGAPGLVVGAGVVGGGLAIKGASAAMGRGKRAHNQAQQQKLSDYRARQAGLNSPAQATEEKMATATSPDTTNRSNIDWDDVFEQSAENTAWEESRESQRQTSETEGDQRRPPPPPPTPPGLLINKNKGVNGNG